MVLSLFSPLFNHVKPAEALDLGGFTSTAVTLGGCTGLTNGAIGLIQRGIQAGLSQVPVVGSFLGGLLGGGDTPPFEITFKKEECLDAIAKLAAQRVLSAMTKQVINWVSEGDNGQPLYSVDLRKELEGFGNEVFSEFIVGSDAEFLCSPFKAPVKIAITNTFSTRKKRVDDICAFKTVTGNVGDYFNGNFLEAGWDGFIEITNNNNYNPYGAYFQSIAQISGEASKRRQEDIVERTFADGFLGYERCAEGDDYAHAWEGKRTIKEKSADQFGNIIIEEKKIDVWYDPNADYTSLEDPTGGTEGPFLSEIKITDGIPEDAPCVRPETVTPGSVVADQLTSVLGSGLRQAELADELNESISAIFGALIDRLTGENQGLATISAQSRTATSAGSLNYNQGLDSRVGVIEVAYNLISEINLLDGTDEVWVQDDTGGWAPKSVGELESFDTEIVTALSNESQDLIRKISNFIRVRLFGDNNSKQSKIAESLDASVREKIFAEEAGTTALSIFQQSVWGLDLIYGDILHILLTLQPYCKEDNNIFDPAIGTVVREYSQKKQNIGTYLLLTDNSLAQAKSDLSRIIDLMKTIEAREKSQGEDINKGIIRTAVNIIENVGKKIPTEQIRNEILGSVTNEVLNWDSFTDPETGARPGDGGRNDFLAIKNGVEGTPLARLYPGICYGVFPINTELANELFTSAISSVKFPDTPPAEESPEEIVNVPRVDLTVNGHSSVVANAFDVVALSWTSQQTTSCSASWTGQTGTSGSVPYNVETLTTSLSIACESPSGAVRDSVSIIVK